MTASDLDLLGQYGRQNSEEAYATLVGRHLNLVYSAALRQVNSPQLAEEVAQSVFTDLARNALKLKPGTVLTAWLYQVTRRTAIDMVRKESSRQLREKIALELADMKSDTTQWTQIRPLLDEAMEALDEADRSAILLRYFENRSLREVGQNLGTSEDAAQKRVSRAVERLRELISKQGITVGAGSLAALLSVNAVQSAPAGLQLTISAAATFSGAAIHNAITIGAVKTVAMTTIQKTLITSIVALTAGVGIYEAHRASRLQDQLQTEQEQQAPLIEQVQELRQERDEATNRLAALNRKMAQVSPDQPSTELLKLRGEVARLRAQLGWQRHQKALADHTPGSYIAKDDIAFSGYATSEAALETMFWANLNGTYEDVVACLTPEAQTRELNDSGRREQYESVKAAAAQLYKGLQIIASKTLADDQVELKFKNDHDSTASHAPEFQHILKYGIQAMVKVGNEWKVDGQPRSFQESWEEEGEVQKFVR